MAGRRRPPARPRRSPGRTSRGLRGSGSLGKRTSRRMTLALACAAALTATALAPAAAPAAVTANGSVEQVYVTDAKPGAKLTLFDRKGDAVNKQKATAEGGLLYRRVKPGGGYRVGKPNGKNLSKPVTVLPNRSEPPSESIYDQEIEPSGYQYLKTRDGTELAITVHPATDVSQAFGADVPPRGGERAAPDADRVLRLRDRRPRRARERDLGAREHHGLHGRRREHARYRLLRRRLRLLRAPAEPRRIRRDRDDRAPAVGRAREGRDARASPTAGSASCSPPRPSRRAWRRSRRYRSSTRRRPRSTPAASSTPASRSPGRRTGSTTASRPAPTPGSPGRGSRSRPATRPAEPTR